MMAVPSLGEDQIYAVSDQYKEEKILFGWEMSKIYPLPFQ